MGDAAQDLGHRGRRRARQRARSDHGGSHSRRAGPRRAQEEGEATYDVYAGRLDAPRPGRGAGDGLDPHEMDIAATPDGQADVEVVLSEDQADGARRPGRRPRAEADRRPVGGRAGHAAGRRGLRGLPTYGGAGGLKEEFEQIAADNPDIVKLVTIGQSVNGPGHHRHQGHRAGANQIRDGQRPATLYSSAQHAREWITPEMNRRLAHHIVDSYGSDPTISRRGRTTPSSGSSPSPTPTATTSPSSPATGCGARTCATTTATATITPRRRRRPQPQLRRPSGATTTRARRRTSASETYRGTGPGSEPETQALDGLMAPDRLRVLINYHSAAELLLYGIGWQVATPSPDDLIYEAMAGDDAEPGGPGLRPRHLRRALHHQRRDDRARPQRPYGTLAFTPEMATCETVERRPTRRRMGARRLHQRLQLPRRRGAGPGGVREEHPVRARRPPSRRTTPTTRSRSSGARRPTSWSTRFDVSYGDPQTVAVTAPRGRSATAG